MEEILVDVNSEKEAPCFSKVWWGNFIKLNHNFTHPVVMHNVLDTFSEQLWADLQECLIKRIKLDFKDFDSFNLYINGKLTNHSECSDFFSPIANSVEQDIFNHLHLISDTKQFGMILNCCEQFSDNFVKTLHNIISPLTDISGSPVCGLDATVFIGNYRWTPLGIHQDQPGENVLHLHLGPGDKTMYVWESDDYNKLIKKYFDEVPDNMADEKIIEELLPFAKKYHFKAGDLYYMPWNNYHIGYTPGLSYGTTIWFNSATEKQLALNLIENMKQNVTSMDNDKHIQPRLISQNEQEIISTHKQYLLSDKSSCDFIESNFKDYRHKIDSNGGWRFFPYSRNELQDPGLQINDWDNTLFKCALPFKMLCFDFDSQNLLYLRGTRLVFLAHPKIKQLISSLNRGDIWSGKDIFEYLSPWPAEAAKYLLDIMYNYRAIEVVI